MLNNSVINKHLQNSREEYPEPVEEDHMMFELTMAELKTAFREGDKSWFLVATALVIQDLQGIIL